MIPSPDRKVLLMPDQATPLPPGPAAPQGPSPALPCPPLPRAPAGRPAGPIQYPERDGKPMADNTKQARWIFVLYGNLCALFREVSDVFVAADLFWYAVEGDPGAVQAPDVLVVFGRPRGD